VDKRANSVEVRGQVALTSARRGPRVVTSPEGPSDTNDRDRIKVHVLGRFLRALRFPGHL